MQSIRERLIMATKLDFGQLEICIAEDDRFMQKLIKSMLDSLGVNKIRLASDGDEAYGLLRFAPSDLILIDWSMKPTSGIDLVRKIRKSKDKTLADTPVIMLTAHSEREYVEKAVIAGANDYLVKPVSPLLLKQRINGIFKTRMPISMQAKISPAKIKPKKKISSAPPENDRSEDEEDFEIIEI